MMLWNNEKKDDIIMKCPKERSTKMGRIIAIANQKGGVGKTTTAINLSASLASLGKKVLAIDMDPQGNMSSGLGVDKNEVEKTVYDLIIGNIGIEECIYEEVIENLDVLPSNIDLSAAEIELIGVDNKEYILRDEVNKVKEKYDFIIIDCPPALSKMPQMNMESGCYYVYPEFQDYIRKADVISIQIGSNDAFVPCVAGLWNATNHKSDALASIILSGNLRSSGSAVSTILKGIKDMELTKEEKNASWKLITSDMAKICDRIYPQTTSALISVVQEIRKLNPDVQILLMGYTDPVPFIPCWHNYFRKLNKFEKQLAETYDLTYVAIPKAKTDLDVHPTIQGHEYIANKIVNAIDVKAE